MSDFASQVLPETLYRVKLGRIGWQCHQLDLLRVSCKQGKNRFGKMDAIVNNDNVGPFILKGLHCHCLIHEYLLGCWVVIVSPFV